MKISDMTEQQREAKRAYDREKKRQSRAAKRESERRAQTPTADEAAACFATDHPERVKELDVYVKGFAAKVTEELGRGLGGPKKVPSGYVVGWNHEEEFTVDRVARVLLGLKKGWIQNTQRPDGELVSGAYFADVSGDTVEFANRYGLKKSPTFAAMYRELLEIVDKRYGGQPTPDAAIVKTELAGRYELRPLPELPKPEPPKAVDEPLPSMAEILERGRIELLSRIRPEGQPPRPVVRDPNIAPAAQRYLDGL